MFYMLHYVLCLCPEVVMNNHGKLQLSTAIHFYTTYHFFFIPRINVAKNKCNNLSEREVAFFAILIFGRK